jgi:hypothetical protein
LRGNQVTFVLLFQMGSTCLERYAKSSYFGLWGVGPAGFTDVIALGLKINVEGKPMLPRVLLHVISTVGRMLPKWQAA